MHFVATGTAEPFVADEVYSVDQKAEKVRAPTVTDQGSPQILMKLKSSSTQGSFGPRTCGRTSSHPMAKSPSTTCVATVVTAESVRNLHRLADTWSGPMLPYID